MEITEVKNILGITTSKHDAYLTAVIPLFIDTIKTTCNNEFIVDGSEQLPGAMKIAVAKWAEFNMHTAGVNSRSQGVSYSYDTDVPDSIMKLIRPFKKVKFT